MRFDGVVPLLLLLLRLLLQLPLLLLLLLLLLLVQLPLLSLLLLLLLLQLPQLLLLLLLLLPLWLPLMHRAAGAKQSEDVWVLIVELGFNIGRTHTDAHKCNRQRHRFYCNKTRRSGTAPVVERRPQDPKLTV